MNRTILYWSLKVAMIMICLCTKTVETKENRVTVFYTEKAKTTIDKSIKCKLILYQKVSTLARVIEFYF